MAERRFVKCVKCGSKIDKRESGWEYNEKSRRYTCYWCAKNALHSVGSKQSKVNVRKKDLSSKGYKVCGIIMKVLAILIILMSLLMMIASLSTGGAFMVFGILCFLLGSHWTKKAKAMDVKME